MVRTSDDMDIADFHADWIGHDRIYLVLKQRIRPVIYMEYRTHVVTHRWHHPAIVACTLGERLMDVQLGDEVRHVAESLFCNFKDAGSEVSKGDPFLLQDF